jgi:hypothetical protein
MQNHQGFPRIKKGKFRVQQNFHRNRPAGELSASARDWKFVTSRDLQIFPYLLSQRRGGAKGCAKLLNRATPPMLFLFFIIKKRQEENDMIADNNFAPLREEN